MIAYSHLVFTGGGLTGISYLGIIRYLQERGLQNNIHDVAGTSIGALFACIFAMDIPAGEVEEYLKEFFKKDENTIFPIMNTFMAFLDTYGFDDGERMIKPVKDLLKKKYNWKKNTICFREFVKKTGKNIVLCATNVHKKTYTYFSVDTTPDVCVYDALQASMTLPFFMRPIMINNEMYVDGALSDDIPFRGFKNVNYNSMLIIAIKNIENNNMIPNNIINYLVILIIIMINNSRSNIDIIKDKSNTHHCLFLNDPPIPFLKIETTEDCNFKINITDDDIDGAIAYGYTQLYEFINDKKP